MGMRISMTRRIMRWRMISRMRRISMMRMIIKRTIAKRIMSILDRMRIVVMISRKRE